jgi:hypothetical protein
MKVNLTAVHGMSYVQNHNNEFNFGLITPGSPHQLLVSWFQCKDYLQDIFWSEHRQKAEDCCGLKWAPGRLDPKAPRYLLLIHNGKDGTFAQTHRENLVAFLNAFEAAQEWPLTIGHLLDGDGRGIVLDFPREWTESSALISAFSSLIRISAQFKKGMDPGQYLGDLKPFNYSDRSVNPSGLIAYMTPELCRLPHIVPRLRALLAGKKVNHPWSAVKSMSSAHGSGIIG